jgi:hypothetical protein
VTHARKHAVAVGATRQADAILEATLLLATSIKLATLHANITAKMLPKLASPAMLSKVAPGAPIPNLVTMKILLSAKEKPNVLLVQSIGRCPFFAIVIVIIASFVHVILFYRYCDPCLDTPGCSWCDGPEPFCGVSCPTGMASTTCCKCAHYLHSKTQMYQCTMTMVGA